MTPQKPSEGVTLKSREGSWLLKSREGVNSLKIAEGVRMPKIAEGGATLRPHRLIYLLSANICPPDIFDIRDIC